MTENNAAEKHPISTVRFGTGKEIRLYTDELVVTGQEENQEIRVALEAIKRLTLVPGRSDPDLHRQPVAQSPLRPRIGERSAAGRGGGANRPGN